MIDALHAVRVPTVEEEALRDLVRAREDVRGDLMRARQRLSELLLRHGILYEDTSSTWTQRHRPWLRAQDLGGGAQTTLLDYLGAIDTLELRRGQLERTISELLPGSPCAQTVARLRCLRGIHAVRGWPGRRDRRLRAIPTSRPADVLPRARAGREQLRRDPPATRHHQDRPAARVPRAGRGGLALVRHEALCCIPCAAGTKLEGRFVGLMAYPDPRGERNNRMPAKWRPAQVSGPGRRGTRVMRRKLDCLNPNLQTMQRPVRRKDTRDRRHALRRLGSAAIATFGAGSVAR